MRRSKYGSKWTRCNQGHTHQSKLEARSCNHLELARRGGEIQSYQTQKVFEFRVNGQLICIHKPDFTIIDKYGKMIVYETKGARTAVFNLKKKLFEALYPEIPYILIGRGRSYGLVRQRKRKGIQQALSRKRDVEKVVFKKQKAGARAAKNILR